MFELIQSELAAFERRLEAEVVSSVAFISAIGDDLVGAGGKRLRPALAFLAGQMLEADAEATMRVALSVELLHSASLLHDDLIDDADTRRGHEAAFRRYGNVVSVMSGDYLLAQVLGMLAETDNSTFTALLSRTAAQICEGEVLQFEMATLESYSFDNYRRIIEGKTAVLIAAALEGVALLAGSDPDVRSALAEFGLRYGRAFQMRDDFLDLLGDEDRLGKPVGGDLREGKATFPILLLLDAGVGEASDIVRRHAKEPGDVARMLALIRAHGSDLATRERIAEEVAAALEKLDTLPLSPASEALAELARQELDRVV